MDRTILYSQETLRSFDILGAWSDILYGLAYEAQDILGKTTTVVSGFAATPDAPADLSVNLAAGRIFQQAVADATAYGSNAADSTLIMQQGIAQAQRVTLTTAALTTGQSQWALVQAQFSQLDTIRSGDPTGGVLNFWNPNNPSQPFIGPNNNGLPLNTVRKGAVVIQVIYGTPATTGSEVPPNPTFGFVPLYLIDLAYGQVQINSGNILVAGPSVGTGVPNNYPAAPFLTGLLNGHHKGTTGQAPQIDLTAEVQNVLPLGHLPASSAVGGGGLSTVYTYAGNPNTHVAGIAGSAGVSPPDFCWDITDGQLYVCSTTGNAAAAVWITVTGRAGNILWGGTSTGSANVQVLTPSPALPAYTTGTAYGFIAGFTNTNATTINVSGLGAKNIYKQSGGGPIPLTGGEIVASNIYTIQYDGTEWQLVATNSILATLGIGYGLRNQGDGNLQTNDQVNTFGSNHTCVASDHKTSIVATASIALTIPHVTTLWNGWGFHVQALGGSVTLTPNAADKINSQSVAATLVIPQGSSARVVTNGSDTVYATVGGGSTTNITIIQVIGCRGDWDDNHDCHWQVDQCNAGSSLGGASYQGQNLALSFNSAASGANGMDTGSVPIGGSLYVYAIYNPSTNVWATLGTTSGSGARIYAGVNLPTGYIASCLLSAHCTDGSGFIRRFHQRDRSIHHIPVQCLDNTAAGAINVYQSISIASIVPVCATHVRGNCGSSNTNGWNPVIALACDANGTAAKRCVFGNAAGATQVIDNYLAAVQFDKLPLQSSQLFYWKAADRLTRATIDINGYDF